MNREQRRQAARSKSAAKPPGRPRAAPHIIALHGASLLRQDEIARIIAPVEAAIDALREGRSVPDSIAATNLALMLIRSTERQGVVTETGQYVAAAEQALEAICTRAHGGNPKQHEWHSPTLYAAELDAITLLLDLLRHVLRNVSVREIDAIAKRTEAWARQRGMEIIGRT